MEWASHRRVAGGRLHVRVAGGSRKVLTMASMVGNGTVSQDPSTLEMEYSAQTGTPAGEGDITAVYAVDGLEGGRLALVMKLHHSTLDGATGSAMMGSLMDLSADARPPSPPAQPFDPPPLPSALELMARSVGANPFGPRVAVNENGTWRYVDNPRGGLEIWLGSKSDKND